MKKEPKTFAIAPAFQRMLQYFTGVAGFQGEAARAGQTRGLCAESVYTYLFGGGNDGANPYAGLLIDKNGNLFGATYEGGGTCNCGMIFKITASGSETVLFRFTGGNSGAFPQTTLTADKKGNLYGTTTFGGAGNGGTVFRLAHDNTETVPHSFLGSSDGASPFAGLAMDQNGDLFGTTQQGGSNNAGTVFEVTGGGQETVLYSFTAGRDGGQPFATVSFGKATKLYGTTSEDGANGFGTVFALKYKK